jgi:hypothetical protein
VWALGGLLIEAMPGDEIFAAYRWLAAGLRWAIGRLRGRGDPC